MVNDCDNHTMVNDCDDHTGSEYDWDNHIGLASYPLYITCQSYPCENDHESITSFLTLSTNESSCTNVILTTKKFQSLVDNAVESRNTWIMRMVMEKLINNILR